MAISNWLRNPHDDDVIVLIRKPFQPCLRYLRAVELELAPDLRVILIWSDFVYTLNGSSSVATALQQTSVAVLRDAYTKLHALTLNDEKSTNYCVISLDAATDEDAETSTTAADSCVAQESRTEVKQGRRSTKSSASKKQLLRPNFRRPQMRSCS